MSRILLINPEESRPSWPIIPRAVEPLGLLYVMGAFLEANIDVTLLDLQLGYGDPDRVYQEVTQMHFAAVGIALATQACFQGALAMARRVKQLCPSIPVFTGGVFATLNAPWLVENCRDLDFVVIGEAEPFVEAFVENRMKWKHLPFILHRDNKETFGTRLPVPVLMRPAVKPDRSLTSMVIDRGEYPSVAATRGCGGRCSFCCIHSYYGGNWQPRHVDDVTEELTELATTFNARRIHLVDDNLFGHVQNATSWRDAFFQALSRHNRAFHFKTTCRLDDLDENLIPQLQQAGFTFLKIGIETFCKEAQKIYGKPINRDDAIRKLDLLQKENIHVSLGFINFDPYCTVQDLLENVEFLQRYPDSWNRYLLRSRLTAYRGTILEKRLWQDGLATASGITGTQWKFRDAEAAEVYQRFEHLLQTELLDMEQQLHDYQKSVIRRGEKPPKPVNSEKILKECWIDLFKHALDNTMITAETRWKLQGAAREIDEYCKNG